MGMARGAWGLQGWPDSTGVKAWPIKSPWGGSKLDSTMSHASLSGKTQKPVLLPAAPPA